jgi:hypothetical protein
MRLTLALFLVLLLPGTVVATPVWVQYKLEFGICVFAPTLSCSGAALTDLESLIFFRMIDGGDRVELERVYDIAPGEQVCITQRVPGESESVQFEVITVDTCGNTSETCGRAFSGIGAVRLRVQCGTFTVGQRGGGT